MNRRLAALAALALLGALPTAGSAAEAGPALAVDVSADRHPISPDVYGMNWGDPALEAELGVTADRWGGNGTTRYNWKVNGTNDASDWYFENVHWASGSLDTYVSGALDRGAQPVVTVPMSGWVAKDAPTAHPYTCSFPVAKYGPQQSTDPWDPACGNGVHTNGTAVTGNDPTETSVAVGAPFVQEMVAHLVSAHGSAASGGVRTYGLDNEPALWNSTHRDVHPAPLTYDELRTRSVATATAVKAADSGALVEAPGDWGWCAYFYSAADGCSAGSDASAHGGKPFAEWFVAAMHTASTSAGKRLLDYFDEHYYPQASGVPLTTGAGDAATQAKRLRSTRSLWDPTYVDESWIGTDVGAPPIRLIPWLHDVVDANYPGTKTAIGEYNFGGTDSLNGALTQADVLGIFGRERLDRALMWDPPTAAQKAAFAFRVYRDYDGAGSRYGDTWVRSTSADQGKLSVYGAQRSSDGAVTIVVVNKTGTDLASSVALSGAAFGSAAQVWSYSGADLGHIVHLADAQVSGGAVSRTFPASSITLLVVPTTGAQPASVPTVLTAGLTPSNLTYGATATLKGHLYGDAGGLGGRTVLLEARRFGTSTWQRLATVTSAADGLVTKTFTPAWGAAVRWRFPGDATYVSSVSAARNLTVRAKVTSTISPATIPRRGTAYITGGVYPAHPGTRYSVQEWTSASGWQTLGTAYLPASSTYRSAKSPTTPGTKYYRVYWWGDTDHAAAYGPVVTLHVT